MDHAHRASAWLRAAVLAATVAGALVTSPRLGAAQDEHAHVPGAHALESRLVAPCCWIQTLDVHDSPLATELRVEIRRRLTAGESSEAIEDDLALRYGEAVRAVPRGEEPRGMMALVVTVALLVSVLGVVVLGRRWVRTPLPRVPVRPSLGGDAYDARLEAELRALADEPS
jgi:cytochrome c-type biogenesis protein CcmH